MTPAEQLARSIVERLQGAGHIAYFAGGCVRDRLMNRPPKDFDVATSATPAQVLQLFPRGHEVGAAFGVILLRDKRGNDPPIQIEVATFRSDGTYSDGRHPDSVHFTTAEIDAQRRDFTCNGLFYDPVADRLHDFVGGQKDIAGKTLRAIGDPEARFREDHLRMLRAIRFAARLDFAIEPLTRAAIERHAPHIRAISRERVGEELRMILQHPSRAAAVRLLRSTGLLAQIWPSPLAPFASSDAPCIAALPNTIPRTLALAALVLDNVEASAPLPGVTANGLQHALALANDERDDIAWLLERHPVLADLSRRTRSTFKKLLADRRWPALHALYVAARNGVADPDLDQWAAQLQQEPGGVAPAPFVTGDTLIQLGAAPGRQFKLWLEQLYDRQLENEFPTAESARSAAEKLIAGSP